MFTLHIPNLTLPNKNLFAVSLPNPNGIPSFSPGLRGTSYTGSPAYARLRRGKPIQNNFLPQRGYITSQSARGLAHGAASSCCKFIPACQRRFGSKTSNWN